jgi:hypothetical protein
MTDPLDTFCDLVRTANPFIDNRVSRPSATDVDVAGIHDAEFRRVVDLARQAHALDRGTGAVLWGDAGAGKSHLLGRLGRWAEADDKPGHFLYLYNLQARADRLPRYVLRCAVSVLTHGRQRAFHDTPLYDLVRALVNTALPDPGARRSLPHLERAYAALLERLAARDPARFDRNVYQVLLRFYVSANVAHYAGRDDGVAGLAVHWLAGEYLEPAEARLLGLRHDRPPDEPAALADNEQIKLVFVALTRAAALQGKPFLLCFDQPAENLEPDQVSALARFLHDLIDSAGNLLVLTSSVEDTLKQLRTRGTIPEPSWHRLAQFAVRLPFLTADQARAILEERLKRFLEPFHDLPAVQERLAQDALFPLGTAWFDDRLRGATELRPRQVIDWARERWESQQEALAVQSGQEWLAEWTVRRPPPPPPDTDVAALIDARVEHALVAQKVQRLNHPETLPASADHLAGLVRALLKQCLGRDGALADVQPQLRPRPGSPPPYDLLVRQRRADGGERRLGVLFLVNANAVSTAAFLRRLVEDEQPPDLLLLVTDARQPLQLGATGEARGRGYLKQLQERGAGFGHVELSFAEYADLDTLQAVVVQARAGDLEVTPPDGRTHPVSEEEVLASHHRRGRYQAHPLLRRLLLAEDATAPAGADREPVRVPEKAVREIIMAQLALQPETSSRAVVERCLHDIGNGGPAPVDWETCHAAVKTIAGRMQEAGLVRATADGEDLILARG